METRLNRPQLPQSLTQSDQGEPMNDPAQAPSPATISKQVTEANPQKNINPNADIIIDVKNLKFFYGAKQALYDVSLPIREHQVTALIGPSGCGKSTFLRTLNRMNDLIPATRTEGAAMFDGIDIYDKSQDVVRLRQRIGMVFQRPNPFPTSIFENVAYGLRAQRKPRKYIAETVEQSLRRASLWDEVK